LSPAISPCHILFEAIHSPKYHKNDLFEILKHWPCFPIFHGSTSKIDIPALFLKRKNKPSSHIFKTKMKIDNIEWSHVISKNKIAFKNDKLFSLSEIVLLRIILHGVEKNWLRKMSSTGRHYSILELSGQCHPNILILFTFFTCSWFIFNLQGGGG